jgi:hypothetical protein
MDMTDDNTALPGTEASSDPGVPARLEPWEKYERREAAVRYAISSFGQQGCGDINRVIEPAGNNYPFMTQD